MIGWFGKNRAIIYRDRRKVLEENTEELIKAWITYFCEQIVQEDNEKVKRILEKLEELEQVQINSETTQELADRILKKYMQKQTTLGKETFENNTKDLLLDVIDIAWQEHIQTMEYMKDNMELRVYAGYNPYLEYVKVGDGVLNKTIHKIKMNSISRLLFNTDCMP